MSSSTSSSSASSSQAVALAVAAATMGTVAAYDVVVGVAMLAAAEPWYAHGPNTLWTDGLADGRFGQLSYSSTQRTTMTSTSGSSSSAYASASSSSSSSSSSLLAQRVVMSLMRRTGAFSLCIGLFSMFVAFRFRRDRRTLLQFMTLYMVAGLGFAVTDNTFFANTAYYWLKQGIGAAWMLATLNLWWRGGGGEQAKATDENNKKSK